MASLLQRSTAYSGYARTKTPPATWSLLLNYELLETEQSAYESSIIALRISGPPSLYLLQSQSAVASTDLSDFKHTHCEWLVCESLRLLVGRMIKRKDKRNGKSLKVQQYVAVPDSLNSLEEIRSRLLSLLHPGCIDLTDLERRSLENAFLQGFRSIKYI